MEKVKETQYTSEILNMGSLIDKNDILISDEIIQAWQNIVNTIAEIINVPSAVIMKVDPPYIEVFRSNESHKNPYKTGHKDNLAGLYCEKVIETQERLLIPNALKEKEWTKNREIKLGMISYLGFPLFWPDGGIFGTICILDSKENRYEERYEKLMIQAKGLVEAHLALLYQNKVSLKNLEDILNNLIEGIIAHDIKRRIIFFNRAAEKITGYSREEIIGQDCHKAFGTPFCGGRCSFNESVPDSWEDMDYPLNIITKQGKPCRIEMKVSGMNDKRGRFLGVLASFRDVTDLIGLKIQFGGLRGFAGIIGKDPKMLEIYRQIRDLSTNDYPVHIMGETGTGKELVANAIYNESRRGGGPFVPVNCAALPEGILESELFGHVRGAFTGAVRDKKGRFELAHRGTLFLDEIADLSPSVQAKLLRVLQEGTFQRVGGEKTTSVDVRLISATNRDLKQEVERGNFRKDLYYRIGVVPVHIPSLRERKGDIPLLVEYFLEKALDEGQKVAGISKEAVAVMTDYPWPGNVRELQSAVWFSIVHCKGRAIQLNNLPPELRKWKDESAHRGPARKLGVNSVQAALTQCGGNKAKAARLLGVGRATLYRFLADFPNVS